VNDAEPLKRITPAIKKSLIGIVRVLEIEKSSL